MISRGDSSARNAFCAGLREETPLPISANATQELEPRDVLEVQDVADAIARAEQEASSRSIRLPRDVFDRLARGAPTDDASGPALPATAIPTPPSTEPLLDPSEDAYYHPGGRVRCLADMTLEGYRPEPTLAVRLRQRRHTFGWLVVALLLPLAVLAAGASLTRRAEMSAAVTRTTHAVATRPAPRPESMQIAAPAPARSDVPVFDVKSLPPAKKKTY